MQRNPHSYQIATGYRTFYSLSLIYQPITKKRLFLIKKNSQTFRITAQIFSPQNNFIKISSRIGINFINYHRQTRVILFIPFVTIVTRANKN